MTRNELLRKWVEALESGKYQQGGGALHRSDKFCCLGVLCEISGMGRWTDADPTGKIVFASGASLSRNYLPPEIREIVRFDDCGEDGLVEMNDDGDPFSEIAQRIRRMFPDVFAEQVA